MFVLIAKFFASAGFKSNGNFHNWIASQNIHLLPQVLYALSHTNRLCAGRLLLQLGRLLHYRISPDFCAAHENACFSTDS